MIRKNLNERFVSPADIGANIKQLLPIPDYLTLMVVDIDEANNEFLREYKDLFWPYLLALIEYEDGKTAVAPYSIDQDCIDMDAEIMGKRTCPKCGAEMTIMDRNHSRSIRYYCSECDYSDEGIPDN